MCEGFRNFENFLKTMGERPPGKTVDRIKNEGNYSCGKCAECIENGWPENCHWATQKEQNRNTRRNVVTTVAGVTGCLSALAEHFGIPTYIIYARINDLGWSHDKAFLTPHHPRVTVAPLSQNLCS